MDPDPKLEPLEEYYRCPTCARTWRAYLDRGIRCGLTCWVCSSPGRPVTREEWEAWRRFGGKDAQPRR